MSFCPENSKKIWKLCMSNEDYYFLLGNIILISVITILYKFRCWSNSINNKGFLKGEVTLKHSFTPLGEGALSPFYTQNIAPAKNQTAKKKVTSKGSSSANPTEKQSNSNELKCKTCGRTVEVSYNLTMNKEVNAK
jgi:hypothetical protein